MPKQPFQTADLRLWPKLKPVARAMRSEPTDAEYLLWQRLRRRELSARFRRQHQIGRFIVDFVCLSERLVIEVDGAVHDDPDQRNHDTARDEHLAAAGFTVLRYSNERVFGEIDAVIADIQRHVRK
jgi:very-short-patch-repair endonuclease